MTITVKNADLDSAAFIDLVNAHKATMLELSPPESSHALLIDGLRSPDIHVWSMFDGDNLIGCGALKILSPRHGEIKAMHVRAKQRGTGLGKLMLMHIISEAQRRNLQRLSLETGSKAGFLAARKLYETNGFAYGSPFGTYRDDPNSVFMSLEINT